ncbi:hypothetical protein ACFHW0_10130 [Micromonospora sp. LOL_025]|uniref:hypothetical protein n=1 Tax=Micromonospora sp. LOL_025 TaxID=3345413 RepID=UPI003A83AD47
MFVPFDNVGGGRAAAGFDEAEAGLGEVGERGHPGKTVPGGLTGGPQLRAEVSGVGCRRGKTLRWLHGDLFPLILVAGPAGTCIELNKDTAAAWQATEKLATLQQAHTDLADDLAAYEADLGRAAGTTSTGPASRPAPRRGRAPKA